MNTLQTAEKSGRKLKRRKSHFIIDLHGHVFVPRAEERVAKHPQLEALRETERKFMGEQSFAYNLKQMAAVIPKLTDMNTRLQDMDRLGIDMQVISPSPRYHYWADQEIAADAVITSHIAAWDTIISDVFHACLE